MTNLPGIYMRAPETWPFKTPTIPSKLVPSHKTYAPNNEGLVFVDPCDIATLLGLGFYLYGQTPDINALLAGLPGAGDSSMFLAMDGVGRTPAGGGSSGLVLIPAYSGPITSPVSIANFPLPTTGYAPKFRLELINIVPSTTGVISAAFYFSGVPLNDLVNFDSYQAAYFEQIGTLGTLNQGGYTDSLLDLSGTVPSLAESFGVGCSLFIDITCGSADFFSQVITQQVAWNASPSRHEIVAMRQSLCVNPTAVAPPPPARCDKIAVVVYGNGDIPPSGNDTFTCQWAGLYGQPI